LDGAGCAAPTGLEKLIEGRACYKQVAPTELALPRCEICGSKTTVEVLGWGLAALYHSLSSPLFLKGLLVAALPEHPDHD
jgi:hypothetical protein